MNRSKGKIARRKSFKKKNSTSEYQKWIRWIQKNYGVFNTRSASGMRQMMIITRFGDPLVPRIPAPNGPSPGAHLTTVQHIDGFSSSTGLTGQLIRQSGSTDVLGQIAFELSDLAQVATFATLFDQYRVEEVHIKLTPTSTSISLWNSAAPNHSAPHMYVVVDRDDASAPASITALREYDNVVVLNAADSADIIMEPSLTPSVFAGGVFNGYLVEDSGRYWVDLANTSVPFYGIKFGVSALQATTTSSFDWFVDIWYKISFRNVR